MSNLLPNYEEQLSYLSQLQKIDIQLDFVQEKKGVLPASITKLEATILGFEQEVMQQENKIATHHEFIGSQQKKKSDSESLIKKYEIDLKKIKNQREYEAISKDLELEKLEVLLNQKRIKENKHQVELLEKEIEKIKADIDEAIGLLKIKKDKLDVITQKSQEEQNKLIKKRVKIFKNITEEFYVTYQSIRTQEKIAVANIENNACNNCFIIVPPQIQLNIKDRKSIFYCENCGRFLNQIIEPPVVEKPKRRITRRKSKKVAE